MSTFIQAVILGALSFGLVGRASIADVDQPFQVPFVRILLEPSELAGKRIGVVGFLQSALNLQLYMTKDHALIHDRWSSIFVIDDTPDGSLGGSDCVGHYVRIVGSLENPDGVAWQITNIERVILMGPNEVKQCWPRVVESQE